MSIDSSELNEMQREAVLAKEGAFLILAGAGSGKTKVATLRIARLIQEGISPESILGVTFTNKAAQEMKQRIRQLTHSSVQISTFHSLGLKILRQSISLLDRDTNFTVYDDEDSEKVLKEAINEISNGEKIELKPLKNFISSLKNNLVSPDDNISSEFITNKKKDQYVEIYKLYQQKLTKYNAIDFDDLLFLPVLIWKLYPEALTHYQTVWQYLIIDEYQDTNMAQYNFAKLLAGERQNIFAVGDPDQSIYSWRGADISNILNFEKDYPGAKVIYLEQNFRSHQNILNVANALIKHNQSRYQKNLWSEINSNEKVKVAALYNDRQEAEFVAKMIQKHRSEEDIALNEMAIFYRTNAQSRSLEDSLLMLNIPYKIIGGISFYQRREVKDILSYLRLLICPADFIAFQRIINLPKRGLGPTTIDKIKQHIPAKQNNILEFCKTLLGNEAKNLPFKLSAKQKNSLAEFIAIFDGLNKKIANSNLVEIIKECIEKTNYIEHLKLDPLTIEDRLENLDQLINKGMDWQDMSGTNDLAKFLEDISLNSSLDDSLSHDEAISLMTIHNSKGLEFDLSFLVGLEEDLFPHINSRNDEASVEEERRLCYVAVTRAKKHLYLTHCSSRFLWGMKKSQYPSRFLKEIPASLLEKINSTQMEKIASMSRVEKTTPPIPLQAKFAPIEFKQQELVFHQEFGIGQIKEIKNGSLGLVFIVHFIKSNQTKTLVGKYANLTKLK